MKEAPNSKKMPRKPSAAPSTPGTPTKAPNDEILSTLLRLNNFDSSIKDESLDIDLSACVTISADSAAMMSANSLSSTDFWRVLDESAQNAQLDLTTTASNDALEEEACASSTCRIKGYQGASEETMILKQEQPNSFIGTFVRPEMPAPSSSPLKRSSSMKAAQGVVEPQHHIKLLKGEQNKKLKSVPQAVKEELPEPLPLLTNAFSDDTTRDGIGAATGSSSINYNTTIITNSTPTLASTHNGTVNKTISSSFSIFMLSGGEDSVNGNSKPASLIQSDSQELQEEANTTTLEPIFKCLDCDGLVLRGQQEFATHEAIGHRIQHRCAVCERDFEHESALKKHLKTHRSVDARKDSWKKCPDCGKCLKLGSMWMHRKIHSDNKKYGCDICGQKFVQKINLTHHARVHTAEKPYECPECQKRFQERSHLQRHQKYHAQTRSYRCDKCGKMYKTERCLKVHNLVHLEQRPFACNVCDKSFISNSKLKQHSNIHTGERPFKCNYCPRDFTNFPNWLKHTRRRHKVDHKTGEHLENIPSYCSKKSSKTAKQQKATTAKNSEESTDPTKLSHAQPNNVPPIPVNSIAATGATKSVSLKAQQTKRKKKASTATLVSVISNDDNTTFTTTQAANIIATLTLPITISNAANAESTDNATSRGLAGSNSRAPKAKRERKQLSPKQVQKPPLAPPPPLSVKRELVDPRTKSDTKLLIGNFPDLSITSAEELIMEQALEMEECGLYVTPPTSAVDTDNAISSSEATLHFRIKNEFNMFEQHHNVKSEEFISLKDTNQRLLCSSLESSPYSSPASMELGTSATPSTSTALSIANTTSTPAPVTTTFFMPSFALNSQVSGGNLPSVAINESAAPLHQQLFSQSDQPQTLINHFYLHPMSMSMPLLVQPPNQVLPSVDTLLFSSTHAAAAAVANASNSSNSFFHSKSVPPTSAQQKLS